MTCSYSRDVIVKHGTFATVLHKYAKTNPYMRFKRSNHANGWEKLSPESMRLILQLRRAAVVRRGVELSA